MSHILLAACDDAADLRNRVLALVEPEGATIHTDLTTIPDPAEVAVALVLLSPQSSADPAVRAFVRAAAGQRFPLVAVVEDRRAHDFNAVTLPETESLNAIGWQPGDGAEVLDAVRGYLGLMAFPRKKKVFISYRRQDGGLIAERLYKYLRRHEYEPFLDIFQIEAGAPVQSRIMDEIVGKDFVLLIDTPLARESLWVRAEIVEALNQRIPVRALAVGQGDPYPLVADIERLTWNVSDRRMMDRVRDFISRSIAVASTFDQTCRRVLDLAVEAKRLRVRETGPRQVLLTAGGRRALVEYERALPSLERLHRLYRSYRAHVRGPAILVSGDRPIPGLTTEAVTWARGRAPLKVVELHDFWSLLDALFP
jgi:hypothetical protein